MCLISHRIVVFVVSYCFDSISSDLNRTSVLFRLSSLPSYFVPKDSFSVSSYLTYIELLPAIDHPEAFGQHPNADIASQIQQTRNFFDALQSIQPNLLTSESSESDEMVRLSIFSHSYQYSFLPLLLYLILKSIIFYQMFLHCIISLCGIISYYITTIFST